MDLKLISSIAVFATMVLVVIGLLLLIILTAKYEALALDNPEDADKYRERRKTILNMYAKVVVGVFIIAVITGLVDSGKIDLNFISKSKTYDTRRLFYV